MLCPSSARLFPGPALTGMPDAHSISFSILIGGGFFVVVFSFFDLPQHTTRSYLPRAFGQPFMDKGASRWYILPSQLVKAIPSRETPSLSLARTLGKEGRKAMSWGGNTENRQLNVSFPVSLWAFSGCFSGCCVDFGGKRCHDAQMEGRRRRAARSVQPRLPNLEPRLFSRFGPWLTPVGILEGREAAARLCRPRTLSLSPGFPISLTGCGGIALWSSQGE